MPVTIAKNWNTDENFWDMNPGIKSIGLFKTLLSKDKSKGKAQSSNLMWAIALYADPHEENPWRNLVDEEKKSLIATDFLKDPKFNWEHPEIIEYINTYIFYCTTIAEKELISFEKKLVERGAFIMNTKFTLDYFDEVTGKPKKGTADQLDRMLVNTGRLYDQLEEIKAKIAKESAEGHLRGGAVESISEEGLI